MHEEQPLWVPSPGRVAGARITAFSRQVAKQFAADTSTYEDLWRFSVERPEAFWRSVWTFCGIRGHMGERILADPDRMPGAGFFPDARLNFAENLLRRRDTTPAIVFNSEGQLRRSLSHGELFAEVVRFAAALRRAGIGSG